MNLILFIIFFFVPENEAYFNSSSILYDFQSYSNIIKYINSLNSRVHRFNAWSIGNTYIGREIPIIKIGRNIPGKIKPIIFIEAGIHAREWMTVSAALFLIKQLAENEIYEHMSHDIDWYIIPVLNVDGYVYSHSSPERRLWRKNLKPGNRCRGVDLNRNWSFHWGGDERHRDECRDVYEGPHAFSEPETRALRDFMYKLRGRVKIYVTLHSSGELVLSPFAYTRNLVDPAYERINQWLGQRVAKAIHHVNGADYHAGKEGATLYTATGTSMDWMAGVAKIPFVFIIEMSNKKEKFTPSRSRIIPTTKEIFAGFRELYAYMMARRGKEYKCKI